jgi:hypothetical protein
MGWIPPRLSWGHRLDRRVDLAKNVFQLAVADATWRMHESHRLSRHPFKCFIVNRDASLNRPGI